MTKGHNQDPKKQSHPFGKDPNDKKENRHLSDQKQNKSPHQGRNENEDQSGGTKGQNAI
ncbi:hypothetical protein CLV24_101353 [Pontibacter ummariensis]|uniref:Uncharacterized protein n=1 Tax=Pontibacter ummariensis TaxID=1610492 RepID=A0A239BEM4_9BACT|nr:hypothetical protein [Pontibacter ummariensis]PRY16507.1 hypothetical protein CLV24_101353 [Pontibacter ummariensis]SNS06400.1 hypothetical protein SAMN06296052_101353 [Pontibacter ummariensis]